MNDDASMIIKYCGVRGSIPTPLSTEQVRKKEAALIVRIWEDGGIENLFGKDISLDKIQNYLESLPLSLGGTYGGETTCIEIQAKDSPLIIIDTGSGARILGSTVLKRLLSDKNLNPLYANEEGKRDVHIFFTHYHWDHIQGFPFFGPAFVSGNNRINVHFWGKKNAKSRLSHVLREQQQYPNFPVEWQAMPCEKSYKELGRMLTTPIPVGKTIVKYSELDHPDRVLGYTIEINGKKFVCATDTEHRDVVDPFLVKMAKDADILYYDAQYTPEEYNDVKLPKVRWGHSTYEWAIKTAAAANVKTVVLGHHEPTRDDFGLESLHMKAMDYKHATCSDKNLNVVMGYEGLVQKL